MWCVFRFILNNFLFTEHSHNLTHDIQIKQFCNIFSGRLTNCVKAKMIIFEDSHLYFFIFQILEKNNTNSSYFSIWIDFYLFFTKNDKKVKTKPLTHPNWKYIVTLFWYRIVHKYLFIYFDLTVSSKSVVVKVLDYEMLYSLQLAKCQELIKTKGNSIGEEKEFYVLFTSEMSEEMKISIGTIVRICPPW